MGRKPKVPGSLSAKARQALEIEICYVDFNLPSLFTRPATLVAEAMGVSSRAVRQWRKDPAYELEARRLLVEQCSEQYNQPRRRRLDDPPDGTVRGGLTFTDGWWQKPKTKEEIARDRYMSRSQALKRKEAAIASHKAKPGS